MFQVDGNTVRCHVFGRLALGRAGWAVCLEPGECRGAVGNNDDDEFGEVNVVRLHMGF